MPLSHVSVSLRLLRLPHLSRKSEALSFHRRDGTSLTIATKTSGSMLSLQQNRTGSAERSSCHTSISMPSEPPDVRPRTTRQEGALKNLVIGLLV